MKTQIKKTGDCVIINFEGNLDFESAEPLKENLSRILSATKTDSAAKIIFDLENLEFVGSSGISNFVQTLKEFNHKTNEKPRYCNVKSEFKRIIKAFDEDQVFMIHDNVAHAKKSFDN